MSTKRVEKTFTINVDTSKLDRALEQLAERVKAGEIELPTSNGAMARWLKQNTHLLDTGTMHPSIEKPERSPHLFNSESPIPYGPVSDTDPPLDPPQPPFGRGWLYWWKHPETDDRDTI